MPGVVSSLSSSRKIVRTNLRAAEGFVKPAGASVRRFSFRDGEAMRRHILALALILMPAVAAWADDAPAQVESGCGVSADQGNVTIACSGVGEAFGNQFTDILNEILARRLDPQQVMAVLAELDPVPNEDARRDLDGAHRQLLVQALVGKPPEQIAIGADPKSADAGDYGKAIATAILMVGWQVEGNQISRKEIPALNGVSGVVLAVRDEANPPAKALALRAALKAAHVDAALRSDPSLGGDATLLWIGKRPTFNPLEPKS
jgi:hypothetical protein